MINSKTYDFSFSGLKTSVRYFLAKKFPNGVPDNVLPDLCASVQEAIVDVLVRKSIDAALEYNVKSLVIAGGVSANSVLREKMSVASMAHRLKFIAPQLSYCMDNAAMIGFLAEKKLMESGTENFENLTFTVNATALRAKRKSEPGLSSCN